VRLRVRDFIWSLTLSATCLRPAQNMSETWSKTWFLAGFEEEWNLGIIVSHSCRGVDSRHPNTPAAVGGTDIKENRNF